MATERSTNVALRAQDSPLAGAYVVLPFHWDALLTNASYSKSMDLPAGMKAKVIAVMATASTVGASSVPSFTVGSSATAAKYVAATTLTVSLGEVTLVSANQESNAGETIAVAFTTSAASSAVDVCVDVWAMVSAHATAAPGS